MRDGFSFYSEIVLVWQRWTGLRSITYPTVILIQIDFFVHTNQGKCDPKKTKKMFRISTICDIPSQKRYHCVTIIHPVERANFYFCRIHINNFRLCFRITCPPVEPEMVEGQTKLTENVTSVIKLPADQCNRGGRVNTIISVLSRYLRYSICMLTGGKPTQHELDPGLTPFPRQVNIDLQC